MKKQPTIGLIDGSLRSCPRTPNCVSTNHSDLNRHMLPIDYSGLTLDEAKGILFEVLKTIPKVEVVKEEDGYIHAEAKTMVFEYIQDAEFLFDEDDKQLHFRSASRVGYTDFGSNKRRMQSVVARFLRKRDEHLEKQAETDKPAT
ncbi:DUF1499 domain-containing protein [Pullulanibacillus sp. KACC 23026]|uniref:DUF1499 domain-containing protein n=1 Tax=Pullulanibacillus sp. KACC 23026 TaxID=3028315 RepID=UPI0023B095E2|nr:DUF1499 domain-containing protein [Pullulanibacillus sp. KACC 23026]WEG13053.1 DUF1499 domain-containing protein [Pullulanibacillus sp. KACC 23026]